MNGLNNKKRGNIQIIILAIFIVIIIIIIFTMVMLNIQINSIIYPIKQDIFYIAQNSLLAMERNDLSLYSYNVDISELKDIVERLVSQNYNNVTVENVNYDIVTNYLYIDLIVKIKPIILNINSNRYFNIRFNEKVKIKLMDVR